MPKASDNHLTLYSEVLIALKEQQQQLKHIVQRLNALEASNTLLRRETIKNNTEIAMWAQRCADRCELIEALVSSQKAK